MNKRILSVLLCGFLLFGTVFANAVSISFEDLEENISTVPNIYFEEAKRDIEEGNITGSIHSRSPKATNEISVSSNDVLNFSGTSNTNNIGNYENYEFEYIQENPQIISSLNAVSASDPVTMISYISKADSISYVGNDDVIARNGELLCAVYTNTSISNSKYVIYSNAVNANGTKYDLVMYPFRATGNAYPNISSSSPVPGFRKLVAGLDEHGGYKLVITEHGKINNPISMNMILGISDLDTTEYAIFPSELSVIHKGINVTESKFSNNSKKYIGIAPSNTSDEAYDKNCIFGEITIPTSGIIVYYGTSYGTLAAELGFSQIKTYIENNAYVIQFNINGGIGNIPTSIVKYGDNTSTTIGNIGNEVPTKIGYTFKGWSANSEFNDKKIAYSSITGTTKTSSSWTYADYCNYTGGNTSNRTIILYAQWKANQYPVTYIDKDANNNEIGKTTIMVDYDTFVRGSDIGDDTKDNTYYPQYKYVSDTNATVTTNGATVYRIFEFCETEATSKLQWNDDNNADGLRPEKYTLKLKQNGIVIDEVELPSDQTDYTFDHLPKYDENGNPYQYKIETIVSDRYKTEYGDDGSLIFQDYKPAGFSVVIPKTIVLDGRTGNADYTVSVNGTFHYNDTLTVIPENSLTLTDRSRISSMQADVSQQKTEFTRVDGVANGTNTNGSIQVKKTYFSGLWTGTFNFDIKFIMQN